MIPIIFWILNAFICYYLAKIQKRNTTIALILGFLFGVFAILYYIVTKRYLQ